MGGTSRTSSDRSPARRPRPSVKAAPRRRGGFARFARFVLLLSLILLMAMGITGAAVYYSMSSQLPDPDITKARGRDQSTVITDRSGKEIAKLYAEENRKVVPLSDMPVPLRQAVVATEDRRFYEHEGVDPVGIARALVIDIIRRDAAQGGSTITQQYVKQAFVTSEKTLKRKVQEAILAQRVERRYSKDEILERYLNTIYFGHGAYGVEAASRVYFGKSVKRLELQEAAVIAGVLKSPGRYSPYLEPDAALLRRDTVLKQMRDQGYIDEASYAAAKELPIDVVGLKPRSNAAPYFVEWIKERLIREYGERTVYRGGLTVRTTLDLRMQRAAVKAVNAVLDRNDDPSAALVALKPGTGQVLAMVGGRDFARQQFNVAVQGRRQPGSAFKTFVLAAALEKGVHPEATYESGPAKIPIDTGTWNVTGASGSKTGPMRLRTATERSVNSVYAQLIMDVGPEVVVETAEKMGVEPGIEPVPAIALGGLEHGVSPLEMAESYATLAANGVHAEPFGIMQVKDAEGEVLFKAKASRRDALDPAVAYLTTDILRGVMSRGTGTAARIGRQAAGKTGTTQRYRDAWFVGYTPDIATAVWVGFPESQREMDSVHGRRVTGGSFPAEIWRRFMSAALEGAQETRFTRPDGIEAMAVCSETGLAPTAFCPESVKTLVLSGSSVESCTVHTTPLSIKVPELVGLTKEEALDTLELLGGTARVIERVVPGVASGIVSEQRPAPNTEIAVEKPVTIIVSAGAPVNEAPVPVFEVPAGVRAGKSTALDASGSSDDGRIVKYYWEFGDGVTASGRKVTHSWASPGTYEITLWLTDDAGEQASVTHRITVR
jgi:penicillin-binding protein 1A